MRPNFLRSRRSHKPHRQPVLAQVTSNSKKKCWMRNFTLHVLSESVATLPFSHTIASLYFSFLSFHFIYIYLFYYYYIRTHLKLQGKNVLGEKSSPSRPNSTSVLTFSLHVSFFSLSLSYFILSAYKSTAKTPKKSAG